MDEDLAAINANTRNQKVKDFFIKFKKHLIITIGIIILMVFGYFIYGDIQKKNKINLANKYNKVTI